MEQLNAEMEESIRKGTSTFPVEQEYRVSWDGIACWPYLSHNLRTLKKYGINMVASSYGKAWAIEYEDLDGMARAYCFASTNGDNATTNFWLIDWYQYDSSGQRIEVCTTYHNVTDGWYLIIPDTWKDCITISRYDAISGQRAVIFYHLEGSGDPSPFLVIYKFTSQTNRANTSNRFILREEEGAVYAAAVYDSGWELGMSDADLQTAFHLIQSSWSD